MIAALTIPQEASNRIEHLLEQKAFVEAWAMASQVEDPSSARAQVLLQAGDPAGALAEASRGLGANPSSLDLLFLQATSAVWLRDGTLAEEASLRLLAAVRDSSLPAEQRFTWESTAMKRLDESRSLIEHENTLQRALWQCRSLAIAAFALAGAAALTTAARQPQGRSSSPVS